MILVFTLFFLLIGLGTSTEGWLTVKRDVDIEWDLERTPLEIKTASELGSYEKVGVLFQSAAGDKAGGVNLKFSTTLQYGLSYCSTYTNLPTTPPSTVNKIWGITLIRSSDVRVKITCNGEEMLNVLLSETTCSWKSWSTVWNRDVKKIMFPSYDKASDGYRPGWITVERNVNIAWDLEDTPLEIKTDSYLGSGEEARVWFYDAADEVAGGVWLKFRTTMAYSLDYCSSNVWTDLPSTPSTSNRIWKITKIKTSAELRLKISCNGVEVLNLLLSDTVCSYSNALSGKTWSYYWNRDVEKIKFISSDKASDGYRPGVVPKCTGLNSNWNNIQADATFPVTAGTVVKVSCGAGTELTGSETVTCTKDTDFQFSTEPKCVTCPADTYKSSSMNACKSCGQGRVPNTDKTSCVGCTGLKDEWKNMIKTTTQFPVVPGTVVKVTCSDSDALNKGSSEVTCSSGTDFTHLIEPSCLKPETAIKGLMKEIFSKKPGDYLEKDSQPELVQEIHATKETRDINMTTTRKLQ